MLNNFFMIPIVKENARLKLGLVIPTRASATLTKEIIDTPRLVGDKGIKILLI